MTDAMRQLTVGHFMGFCDANLEFLEVLAPVFQVVQALNNSLNLILLDWLSFSGVLHARFQDSNKLLVLPLIFFQVGQDLLVANTPRIDFRLLGFDQNI